jgi:hypothetical protein
MQTVVEELLKANNFDLEDSTICKQWVHDSHTETVSMTNTTGEFTEKICQTAEQQPISIQQNHMLHI